MFSDEALIISEGRTRIVVFGGTKVLHKENRLYRNDALSKTFDSELDAISYFEKLQDEYSKYLTNR
jgi:hypothetical protein